MRCVAKRDVAMIKLFHLFLSHGTLDCDCDYSSISSPRHVVAFILAKEKEKKYRQQLFEGLSRNSRSQNFSNTAI